MGVTLSVFSVFGMIALCGMVVNGAFVLAITRNRYIASGHSAHEAVLLAAKRRFRPIILTALTTFLGLGPMIFESSFQAQYLVPMAIAVGMGTLVSAGVILILIPALAPIPTLIVGSTLIKAIHTRQCTLMSMRPDSVHMT